MSTLTYLSRICWNSEGWRWPTGEAARLESEDSFVSINGFGHEEWLLNSAWQVENWRYGFLQPVNNARPSRVSNTMNILLYTISPAKDRLYVGRINACERINQEEAERALRQFKTRGWFDEMVTQVKLIDGKSEVLTRARIATDILNVRFAPDSFEAISPPEKAAPGDQVCRQRRYILVEADTTSVDRVRTGPSGTRTLKPVRPRWRSGTVRIQYDPWHDRLQNHLFALLKTRYRDAVVMEQERVDITVDHPDLFAYFEVKSSPDARLAVREALGQLLEYAYYPQKRPKNLRLFVAAPAKRTRELEQYIHHLRTIFDINLQYLEVHLGMKTLNIQ